MSTSRLLFATVAALALLAACESSSNGRSNRSSRDVSPASARASDDPANPAYDAPAVHNPIRNCRVLLYDPRTEATIVLVNKKHAWRRSEKGQLAITNGKRGRTYKVLTDRQMDSLLETFKQRGSGQLKERFQQRHASLLRHKAMKGDAFKGIIIVENNGQRHSYIARRPQGRQDTTGIRKYEIFRDMRAAVFVFERAGRSEQVGSSSTGAAPLDQLTVPRDKSRLLQ